MVAAAGVRLNRAPKASCRSAVSFSARKETILRNPKLGAISLAVVQQTAEQMIAVGLLARGGKREGILHKPVCGCLPPEQEALWTEASALWGSQRKTVCLVTHSVREACLLSVRVI